MSYLLHGSSAYTLMGWVDRVPRAGNLFIGGLYALYQTDLIKAAGITHVLSVIDYDPLLQEKFAHLKHFHIRADDHPNENLLRHFSATNAYVDAALSNGGGVFVHCAMGKSRSAALVVAYLMWKYQLGPATALEQLCEGRPVCEPNVGFREQLAVWERMLKLDEQEEKRRVYEGWERNRFMGEWWEWEARGKEEDRAVAKL
ncbi:phosphatases II [Trematosphaeria pertusa]|uniref:protein-tyrosine-phosphatase n=1 Tax=Trematosphaeria pertusa TaxID=390896 RepID=A0A6A6IB11_9PLEO|nr:phosphatases II [Trematosphaeria pertusa]KAF2247397.1 phosphatases II [Trematosphaeria pertusa]